MPDKMSTEKINRIKALGAAVVVAPTNVPAESPKSYYSVARRIARDTPNAIYFDQYNNALNREAHYRTTGPEIWRQCEGDIAAFVCGIGTGGTISGVGRFLKEQNPAVEVVGVDPVGSIFYDYFYTGRYRNPNTYHVEGIGEDYLVTAVDFSAIDSIVQVTDRDSFETARKVARTEGILCGGSSGSALWGAIEIAPRFAGRNIVVLFPDSGAMYLSKFFDDAWMTENFAAECPAIAEAAE
jgi:cystathionine beta-synthase